MNSLGGYEIKPGEIWALTGNSSAQCSEWCSQIARSDEFAEDVALLNFAQHADEMQRTGWPQARYYEMVGKTVAEFLSFNSIYDVNPFEVDAHYPETRLAYQRRLNFIMRLLDLRRFKNHLVIALSNGEMRRALLARALAKRPRLLVLDDPAAGLDARQREKLRDIVSSLAERGLAIIFAYRHLDEVSPGVTRWLRVGNSGKVVSCAPPKPAAQKISCGTLCKGRLRDAVRAKSEPVVEIGNLDLAFGGRHLFKGFSWTVRKGEHWVLRGENGSGKTALFALITGDSPFAYAADIKVFGIPRETGTELARIRRRIGLVSPEMQAYLGRGPEELLDEALSVKHDLLLLDEPFMNLDSHEAQRLLRRIESHLRKNSGVTAIIICHRQDEVPRIFDRELTLLNH